MPTVLRLLWQLNCAYTARRTFTVYLTPHQRRLEQRPRLRPLSPARLARFSLTRSALPSPLERALSRPAQDVPGYGRPAGMPHDRPQGSARTRAGWSTEDIISGGTGGAQGRRLQRSYLAVSLDVFCRRESMLRGVQSSGLIHVARHIRIRSPARRAQRSAREGR